MQFSLNGTIITVDIKNFNSLILKFFEKVDEISILGGDQYVIVEGVDKNGKELKINGYLDTDEVVSFCNNYNFNYSICEFYLEGHECNFYYTHKLKDYSKANKISTNSNFDTYFFEEDKIEIKVTRLN